jgi:predicted PurR-regulated permease PerM
MQMTRDRIFCALAFLCWAVLLYPFPVTVFLALSLACLCLPYYRRLSEHMRGRYAMSLVLLGATLCILLPIALVVLMVLPQTVNAMKILDQLHRTGWLQGPEAQRLLESTDYYLRMVPGLEDGVRQLTRPAADFAKTLIRPVLMSGVGIAGKLLNLAFHIFFMMILTTVFMLYAPKLYDYTRALTRCPADVLDRFIICIRAALGAVVTGFLFVAVIQGILCGIAFTVTGVPQAAFWALLAAFVTLIPFIGTSVIWVPACLYLWFTGSSTAAVGLALWCGTVVLGVDNFLRPYFMRGGIDAPFIVILVAAICGLIGLGPAGLVAGPALMAFALQAAREANLNQGNADSS